MFESITFEVIGDQRLHCESCEQRVARLLKALEGVGQVRAQAHDQRIEVLFDTAVLEATAIAERLRRAGYETRVSPGDRAEERAREDRVHVRPGVRR